MSKVDPPLGNFRHLVFLKEGHFESPEKKLQPKIVSQTDFMGTFMTRFDFFQTVHMYNWKFIKKYLLISKIWLLPIDLFSERWISFLSFKNIDYVQFVEKLTKKTKEEKKNWQFECKPFIFLRTKKAKMSDFIYS